MPKEITALTEIQRARVKSWADEWIAIGLSTERADWGRFEKAIRKCYAYAGLRNDIPIIRVSSPIVGAFAAPLAANAIEKLLKGKAGSSSAVRGVVYEAVGRAVDGAVDEAVGGAVRGAVDEAVRGAVYEAVYEAVDGAVDEAVGGAVRGAVGRAVDGAVDEAVRGAVDEAVRGAVDEAVGRAVDGAVYEAVDGAVDEAVGGAVDGAVYEAVRGAIRDKKTFWHYWLGGQMWSYRPAFAQFFFEVCGLENDKKGPAEAYAELSRSAGYSWPNKDFVMVCDRPIKIQRDANGRLHSEESMAISWPDGWGLFMWHGTRVPAKLIMDPTNVTKEEVLAEKNSEVSRAYAEKLGWEKYFKLTEVIRVDAWTDPVTGLHYELYDFRDRLGEDQPKLLKMESPVVKDGTSPVYVEPVDPRLMTAKAARKWQFMQEDGTWPSAEESNKNPELVFAWEA